MYNLSREVLSLIIFIDLKERLILSNKVKIQKSVSNKTLNVTLIGKIEIPDAESFIETYNKETAGINTKEYILNFDCTQMSITPPGPLLKGCFEMYKKDCFKKVLINIEKIGRASCRERV